MPKLSFVSGLPRSGSTLVCNLLAMHPSIQSTPSSFLNSTINNIRYVWSNNPVSMATWDNMYVGEQLKQSLLAFMDLGGDSNDILIDKNRGWFFHASLLKELIPDFKMIVTLRHLVDIYVSIESRHKKTVLLAHPDDFYGRVDNRAAGFFDERGVVGSVLGAMQSMRLEPNAEELLDQIYFLRFEDLIEHPQAVMDDMFTFLGVPTHSIDFSNIYQSTHEADSYYYMKYSHKIRNSLTMPKHDEKILSERIESSIFEQYGEYFQYFYEDFI